MNIFNTLSNRIKTYQKKAVQIQASLTAIPALAPENGGEGEAEKAEYIKKLLKEIKCEKIQFINAPDERVPMGYRPNILAIIKGKSSDKTIWIMSHMDIVPPGDLALWDSDPYTVIEKEGKLYGRGTEDDQQGFVSAFLALKALQEEGIIPEYNVGLAIVADEENGSKYGIRYILDKYPHMFKTSDIIIIPDYGDAEGLGIEVAEKSFMWVKFFIKGKTTHASTPDFGINAHKAGASLIVKLDQLYKIYDSMDNLFSPPISTFEPTKKEIDVQNIGTIPGQDTFYFDCRILPFYDLIDVKKSMRDFSNEIESQFGVKVDISYIFAKSAAPPTPANTPAAEAIKDAVKKITGKDTFTLGIGGSTVAAWFRYLNLPAVCWCTIDNTLHKPNEYCVIDNVLKDARIFAHIFLQK
jgi:succinyl-diaminopimelate desuccinylase